MNKVLLLIFCCFSLLTARAQDELQSIAILNFNYFPAIMHNEQKSLEYLSIVSGQFVKDGRFSVVERSKLDIIERERELQKSEDFIDGKVVQQGASIGADYMITGYVDFGTKTLTLSAYNVANNELIGKEHFDLRVDYKLKSLVNKDFIHQYFPIPRTKVVKVLAGNQKATSILIAAGSQSGLIPKEKLEVVELVYETIGNNALEREVTIGIVKVFQIENENFTVCKVEKGGKLISEKLAHRKNLFVKKI